MDYFKEFLNKCDNADLGSAKMYAQLYAEMNNLTVPQVMHLKNSIGFRTAIFNNNVLKWYIEEYSFVNLYNSKSTENFDILCAFGKLDAVKVFVENKRLHTYIDKRNSLYSALIQPSYKVASYLLNTDLLDFEAIEKPKQSILKKIFNEEKGESIFVSVFKEVMKRKYELETLLVITQSKAFLNHDQKENLFEIAINLSPVMTEEIMRHLINNFEVYNSNKIKEFHQTIQKKYSPEIVQLFSNFLIYDNLKNNTKNIEKSVKRNKI